MNFQNELSRATIPDVCFVEQKLQRKGNKVKVHWFGLISHMTVGQISVSDISK